MARLLPAGCSHAQSILPGSPRWRLLAAAVLSSPAAAEPLQTFAIFGDLKYPADFKHFDYVNPDAPRRARFAIGTAARQTFDGFNAYILKGDAAQGMNLTFDTLMARAEDEPSAVYSLVAEAAESPTTRCPSRSA